MKKDLNIIEKEVRRCYPNATEEEVRKTVAVWTEKARRKTKELSPTGLMQLATRIGMDWETQMARYWR